MHALEACLHHLAPRVCQDLWCLGIAAIVGPKYLYLLNLFAGQYVAINGAASMWARNFTIGQKKNEHLVNNYTFFSLFLACPSRNFYVGDLLFNRLYCNFRWLRT